jgi:hypothetical protein
MQDYCHFSRKEMVQSNRQIKFDSDEKENELKHETLNIFAARTFGMRFFLKVKNKENKAKACIVLQK